jgi:hypothetical protein
MTSNAETAHQKFDEACRQIASQDVRMQTMIFGAVPVHIYLDQQRQEHAREVASDEPGSIPVWSENESRWQSTPQQKTNFKRSNRLTFTPACVCGDWENLVDQNSATGTNSCPG